LLDHLGLKVTNNLSKVLTGEGMGSLFMRVVATPRNSIPSDDACDAAMSAGVGWLTPTKQF